MRLLILVFLLVSCSKIESTKKSTEYFNKEDKFDKLINQREKETEFLENLFKDFNANEIEIDHRSYFDFLLKKRSLKSPIELLGYKKCDKKDFFVTYKALQSFYKLLVIAFIPAYPHSKDIVSGLKHYLSINRSDLISFEDQKKIFKSFNKDELIYMTNKEEKYLSWFVLASWIFDIPKDKIKPLFSKLMVYEFNTFPIEFKLGKKSVIIKPNELEHTLKVYGLISLEEALKCSHKKGRKSKKCQGFLKLKKLEKSLIFFSVSYHSILILTDFFIEQGIEFNEKSKNYLKKIKEDFLKKNILYDEFISWPKNKELCI